MFSESTHIPLKKKVSGYLPIVLLHGHVISYSVGYGRNEMVRITYVVTEGLQIKKKDTEVMVTS